jgi:hypothetical protein
MEKRKIDPAQWFAELNAAYRTTRRCDLENGFVPSPHSSEGGANAQRYWTPGHTIALRKVAERFEVVARSPTKANTNVAELG